MNDGTVRAWGGAHGFGIYRDEDGKYPLHRYDAMRGDCASIDVGRGNGSVRLWFESPADLDDFIDAVAALRTPDPETPAWYPGATDPTVWLDKYTQNQRKLDQIGEIVNG